MTWVAIPIIHPFVDIIKLNFSLSQVLNKSICGSFQNTCNLFVKIIHIIIDNFPFSNLLRIEKNCKYFF
jgi:hypothetical protein